MSLTPGINLWAQDTGYIYTSTANDALGNPSAAGANKLTGIYLTNTAPIYFGYNNNASIQYGIPTNSDDLFISVGTIKLIIDSANSNYTMGYENLNANTAGSYNTAFGYRALRTNDGSDNIAIGGYEPLYNNSGTDNIALGTSTLFINRGSYNFGAGNEALNRNSGSDNVAIGRTALYSNSGSDNIAIGRYAMQTARAGNNIALGPYALNATSGGGYNVALLEGALRANTGGGNVAIGQAVMNSNSGSYNFGVGYRSLYSNIGEYNIGFGYESLYGNLGNYNFAVGRGSLYSNNGAYNQSLGYQAMGRNIGSYNLAMGYQSLFSNNGDYNIAIGYQALYNDSSASNTIALGKRAGYNVRYGTNNIFIGDNAGPANSTSLSNTLWIANQSGGTPLIFGNFDGGKLGIGTTDPTAFLDIPGSSSNVASLRLRSSASAPTSPNYGDIYTSSNEATNSIFFYDGSTWKDLAAGGGTAINLWSQAAGYLFTSTANDALGNTAAAGANKLTGIYLTNTAPITFGLANAATMQFRASDSSLTLNTGLYSLKVGSDSLDTFFVSGSSGRVGIGTTNPTQALTVSGSANLGGLIVDSTGIITTGSYQGAKILGTYLSDTTVVAGTYGSGSLVPILSIDAQGRINSAGTASITAGVNLWSQAAGYLYTSTANDALGNTAAAGANKLTGIYLTNTAPIVFGLANAATIQFRASDSSLTLNTGLYSLKVGSDSLNTFYVSGSSNRVGIGTTGPTSSLHISTVNGTDYSGAQLKITDPLSSKDLNLGLANSGTYAVIQSVGSIPLAVNPAGNFVGIGITSPAAPLHVVGNNLTDYLVQIESPLDSANMLLLTDQASGDYAIMGFRRVTAAGDGWNFGMGPTNNNFVITSRLSTTNTDRLVVNTVGLVGIGITSPTAFLTLSATSSGNASLNIRSSASAPTSPNYGDIYTSSNESTNSIFFYDGAAWKDLAAGGAAGINLWSQASGYIYTSTANDALGNPSAAGANKLAGIYLTNTAPLTFGLANAASMQFRASDSSLTLNTGLYSFKIGSDPLNTFFVSGSSGRVGIGTTNPTAKLSIAGSSAHISNDTGNITITPAANLIIDQGNVGISNTAPTFLLTMEQSGGGYYSAADHSFHNGSSTRWKENFTPISDALTVIGQLNPVRYNWKEDYGGAKSLGFIAEEIGLIVPEVVDWDPANPGYAFGINYANLTALLAEGIKQQQVQIQGLMTSDTALSEQMMLLSVESSMSDTIPSLSEQMYLLSLSAYENSIQIGDINNKVGNIESQLALLNEILGIGVDQSTESTESSESSSSSSFAGIISQITDIIDEFKNFVSTLGLRADEETESLIVESNLNVLKNTTLSDVTITGDVTTGMIKVSSLDNSINVLGASCYSSENGETDDELCTTQTLFLQKTLAGNIDIFNGKILLEPNGDMKVEGTVEAKQFSVDIAEEESATAGKITVESGEDEVEVKTKAITETALILVTPERPVAVGSKMNETGDGFIITLKESEAEDLKVNWLLVETNK